MGLLPVTDHVLGGRLPLHRLLPVRKVGHALPAPCRVAVRLELRHADVVTSIAAAGSISAAAVELSVPQPSLTTQLRRIERALGGPLFVRSRTGVSPTPLGERLIPMMADLVRRSEAIVLEARTERPVLRLGVPEWTPVGLRRAVDAALPGVEVQSTTVRAGSAVAAVA